MEPENFRVSIVSYASGNEANRECCGQCSIRAGFEFNRLFGFDLNVDFHAVGQCVEDR